MISKILGVLAILLTALGVLLAFFGSAVLSIGQIGTLMGVICAVAFQFFQRRESVAGLLRIPSSAAWFVAAIGSAAAFVYLIATLRHYPWRSASSAVAYLLLTLLLVAHIPRARQHGI